MGKIPRIMPTEAAPTERVPREAINSSSIIVGDVSRTLGNAALEISDQYQKALIIGEKTRAQNKLDSRFLELKTQAQQEQDLSAERQQYYKDKCEKRLRIPVREFLCPESGIFSE